MPDRKASFTALRAISALFLHRLLQPVRFMIIIILVAGYTLTIMLALSFSNWWLLLLLLLIPFTAIFLVLNFILSFLLQRLLPRRLTSDERRQLVDFTDKLLGLAEKTQTPYLIVLFLVAKDVVRGKESQFLRGLVGDSHELVRKFAAVQQLFRT